MKKTVLFIRGLIASIARDFVTASQVALLFALVFSLGVVNESAADALGPKIDQSAGKCRSAMEHFAEARSNVQLERVVTAIEVSDGVFVCVGRFNIIRTYANVPAVIQFTYTFGHSYSYKRLG